METRLSGKFEKNGTTITKVIQITEDKKMKTKKEQIKEIVEDGLNKDDKFDDMV